VSDLEKPITSRWYKVRLHWLSGNTEDITGRSCEEFDSAIVAEVMTRHGYGGGAARALDWWEIIERRDI